MNTFFPTAAQAKHIDEHFNEYTQVFLYTFFLHQAKKIKLIISRSEVRNSYNSKTLASLLLQILKSQN